MAYEKQFWEHEPSPEDDREPKNSSVLMYLQRENKVLRDKAKFWEDAHAGLEETLKGQITEIVSALDELYKHTPGITQPERHSSKFDRGLFKAIA